MPPFVYPTPQVNPYAMSIGELMLHQGDIQANKALALADINAKMLGSISQTIGAIPGQIQQRKAAEQEATLRQGAIDAQARTVGYQKAASHIAGQVVKADGSTDYDAMRKLMADAGLPIEIQGEMVKTAESLDDHATRAKTARSEGLADAGNLVYQALSALPKDAPLETQHTVAIAAAGLAKGKGLVTDQDLAPIFEAMHTGTPVMGMALGLMGGSPSKRYEDVLKPIVTPPGAAINRAGQAPVVPVPAVPRPPTIASLAVAANPNDPAAALAAAKPPVQTQQPTAASLAAAANPDDPQAALAALRRTQATGNAEMEQANAKTVAAGIISGRDAPSILEGTRGTAQGMALIAEIDRQGGDSNTILRNWTATKRAISALNSTQQLRLAETINKASASLDKLDELNKSWQDVGARFGVKVFNRASLTAAQNGLYGPQAASVAQRLDGQIADVTSELGQAVMGGNSPTDHALSLAAKNLSADWTQAVLGDSIKQVRYNLNLAQNARNDILQGLGVTSTQVKTPAAAPKAKDPLGIR